MTTNDDDETTTKTLRCASLVYRIRTYEVIIELTNDKTVYHLLHITIS